MLKHLVIAGLLVAFEAWLGVALIGISCGMALGLGFAIGAFIERRRRTDWFRVAAIYVLMFALTLGVIASNIKLAQTRAIPVISAVNRYHSEHGQYPKTLDELVPAYLPSIPHAGFTLLSRDFRYFLFDAQRPQLYFPAMFHGIFAYDFATETWRTNE